MTTHEVLVKARMLIEREENWTQRALARDRHGTGREPTSPEAVSWCAIGACLVATGHGYCLDAEVTRELDRVTENIVHFNNSRSHAEVLAAFDEAIAAIAPEPDLSFVTSECREAEQVA